MTHMEASIKTLERDYEREPNLTILADIKKQSNTLNLQTGR